MFFRWITKIIVAINSNRRPGELSAGVAIGFLLAMIPSGNLLWVLLLVITLLVKINLAMMLVFLGIFRLLAPALDGLLHNVGYFVLTLPALEGFFTTLFNIPVVPFTRFNNTVVLGGFITGVVLWTPLYFLFRFLFILYRKHIRDKIAESRIIKSITRLPLYQN